MYKKVLITTLAVKNGSILITGIILTFLLFKMLKELHDDKKARRIVLSLK